MKEYFMGNHHNVNFLANETILNWRGQKVRAQGVPHTCPHCGKEVGMNLSSIIDGPLENGVEIVLLVFQCPSCRELTIGRYYSGANVFTPAYAISGKPYLYPQQEFQETVFPKEIYDKFSRFPIIYNQAEKAEHYGCVDIAGAGYRKAAEILVRDFACLIHPNEKENILKTNSAKNVVLNFLKEYSVMARLAEASFELGNDETHYTKVYEDRGLDDLKQFIRATVHEIVAILQLQQLDQERQKKGK